MMRVSLGVKVPYLETDELYTVEYEVYDTSLENKYLNSRDGTYFGYESEEELKDSNDKEVYLEILKTMYYGIDLLSGGRIDILTRTDDSLMKVISELYTKEGDSYLEMLVKHLTSVDTEDYDHIESFSSIDEVVEIVNRDYLRE